MWCVIKKMYESSKSVVQQGSVFLKRGKCDLFNVEQGVAQCCSLSPYYFQYSFMIY